MWRRNGLSLVLFGLMAVFVTAQALTGWHVHNEELGQHGLASIGLWSYLCSGHFISATFENWESEFLQMGMYVLLTVRLRQQGSAESRPMNPNDEQPRIEPGPPPLPVLKGGLWEALYSHSLAIAFFALFFVSFALHALGSWKAKVAEEVLNGRPSPSLMEHLFSSDFWFESMQNWQSEFLAVLALVVLSIFLRQKDSPQSKAVEAPHAQTGD